jgi:hypothetical protein
MGFGSGLVLGALCLWTMNIVYKDLKKADKRLKKVA